MSTSDLLTNGAASTAINGAHASAAGEGPRPPPTNDTSSTTNIPTLSRTRIPPTEAGEADVLLNLGEFQNVPSLSHSEVKFLLDTIMAQRGADPTVGGAGAGGAGGKVGQTDTLNKTQDYLGYFARFKSRESIMAVERVISGYEGRFESFEKSQLSTLCPTDSDEAFTLIPSLKGKFSTGEMDEITRQISDLKTFE